MTVQKPKAKGKPKSSRETAKNPAKQRPPKLLTRRNLIKPADTNETHGDVQRALTNAKGLSELKGKLNLSRDSIVVAEHVFQWRLLDTDVANREDHILDMANVIADGGKPLEAILVLPVGDRFYVIDGHHRLAAYDTAQWSKAIPAMVFGGTLPEARREALRLNSRNKLPMTKDDKQEAAWRLVKQGLGREQIHEWTGASTSNVSKMKAKLIKLKDRGRTTEDLEALTWTQARGDWEPEDGGVGR
jgi:ParB-like nuclease domain